MVRDLTLESAPASDSADAIAWNPSFIHWAHRLSASTETLRAEILAVARNGRAAISALEAGDPDWAGLLVDTVTTRPLIPKRAAQDLTRWLSASASQPARLMRILWDREEPPAQRLSSFIKQFPESFVSSPTNRRAAGTFLIFLAQPEELPFYDSKLLQTAYELSGFPPLWRQATAVPTYVHSLAFYDALIKRTATYEGGLRDRLDAHCAIRLIAGGSMNQVPADWPADDWDSFQSFRSSGFDNGSISGADSHRAADEGGGGAVDDAASLPVPAGVESSLWKQGHQPLELRQLTGTDPSGVVWVHVPRSIDPGWVQSALQALYETEHVEQDVQDLLTPDDLPKKRMISGEDDIIFASLVGVSYRDGLPTRDDGTGPLSFFSVEVLMGDGWLLTCGHQPQPPDEEGSAVLYNLKTEIAGQWEEAGASTSGDIATFILLKLADTYPAALSRMYGTLDRSERAIYEAMDAIENQDLNALRRDLSDVGRRIHAMTPGVRPWFRVSLPALQQVAISTLGEAHRDVQLLGDRIRGSMDLMTSRGVKSQLRLSQEGAERNEELQNQLTLIASVLLVPSVVLSIFGANTELPGRETWFGFAIMMILTVIAGCATYFALHRWTEKRQLLGDEKPQNETRGE